MQPEQFDSALASVRFRLPTLTRRQVIVDLERLAALIGDGQSSVAPWRDTVIGFHRLPDVLSALGLTSDVTGATLTVELNGVTRTVTLTDAGQFPGMSGDIDRSWNARPGWIDLRDGAPAPLWLSRAVDAYWFTYLPSSRTLYCQLNEIQKRGEPLAALFARAIATADSAGATRFVLDLRRNGGENGVYNRAIVRALLRSRFDAPEQLFVITGRRTFSAAQMLPTELETRSNPIIVGEP